MTSSLSAIMFPPPGPADPYDVPASPLKTKKRNDGRSTPSGMTPARDSSIGRDIIRDIDIDRNYDREVDTTVIAAAGGHGLRQPSPIPKEDSIDPQTLQKKPDIPLDPIPQIQIEEPAPAESSQPQAISQPQDLGEVEIDSFETHRIDENNATVDIRVKWVNGEKTWETEWSLQQQVPTLIYKYWDSVGGRDAATGLEVYHVFRVLKREPPKPRKKEFMYQVQWVGYRRSESSWEHESKLKQIAPEELIKFEAKNGSAPDTSTQKPKRGVARGPGRPRKRARLEDE